MTEAENTASALAAARVEGHRVEDLSQRDASTSVFVNPDGTSTAELSEAPRNVQHADGTWTPVDTTLKVGSDGRLRGANVPYTLSLSNGGQNATADATPGPGERAKWMLPGNLPTPTVTGNTARYVNVKPGVDLLATLTPSGFELSYILTARPSGTPSLTFPLQLTGMSSGTDANGDPQLSANGKPLVKGAGALMWDARTSPATSDPSQLHAVAQKVDANGITLSPDNTYLHDPTTEYPVTIDPFYGLTFHYGTYVYEAGPGTNYDASGFFRTGLASTSATRQRTLLRFQIPASLTGKHIIDASLGMYLSTATSCSAQTVIRTASAAWDPTTVTWNTQPAFSGPYDATGFAASCTGKNQTFHMRDVADLWINGGLTNNGFVLTGSPETDSATNKVWLSENSGHTPTLSITYNSYPNTVAGRSEAPSAVNGSTTYVGSTTPVLIGGSTDADGGQDQIVYDVHNATTNATVATGSSPMAPQGALGHWTVTPALTNGLSYYWRALGYDGTDYSKTYSSNVTFTVDTTAPSTPTVTSATYPANAWTTSGANGTFTLASVDTGAGVDHYVYGLDTGTTAGTPLPAGITTLTLSPMPDGWHTLFVQAVDKVGNVSSGTTYQFGATPGFSSPTEAQKTQQSVALSALATGTASTSITFNYRTSETDSWVQIPPADVTLNGTSLTGWPVTGSASTVPGTGTPGVLDVTTPSNLVWNIAHTLGDNDGAVQLQVCFGSSCSLRVRDLTLNENAFGDSYATTSFGPGNVSLLTGNLSISENDVSVPAYGSTLELGRTFNSRTPGVAGPLGPGWQLSLPGDGGGSDWTSVTDAGALLTLTAADGSTTSYSKASSGAFIPTGDDTGDGSNVTGAGGTSNGPATYTLSDLDGNKISFAAAAAFGSPPTATAPHAYLLSSISSPAASGANPTLSYGTAAGLTRVVVAPVPTGGSCSYHYDASNNPLFDTFTTGCRALQLAYDASSKLTSVTLDVNTGGGLTQVDVACYSYDGNGRLLQTWDPRDGSAGSGSHPVTCGTPVLPDTYTYDGSGRIATVTPPGLAGYSYAYDSNNRVSTATRAHSGGGSEISTIVYGVSLGADGSHPEYRPSMGTSDVATWAQSDLPVTATAVFGPGDTASSSDLRAAEVHYLDVNGRDVNIASYAGTGAAGWHISTSEYDAYGNNIRNLTANNREEALNPTGPAGTALDLPTDTAQAALALSSVEQYATAADGIQDLTDSYGPYHLVALGTAGSDNLSQIGARLHTHYTYDSGGEAGHGIAPGPLHVVTQTTTAASQSPLATPVNEADLRTTTSSYMLSAAESGTGAEDDTGWVLRTPMKTVVDAGGLNSTTITRYDATTGEPIESRMPKAATGGGDAATSITLYYTAGANPSDSACGNHPEWANLACKTRPAVQPGTAGVPDLPTIWTSSYDYLDRPLVVQQTVGSTTRTTTSSFTNSGWGTKDLSTSISGGVGAAVPTSTTSYDANTGLPVTVSTAATSENPATSSTTAYDDFGRTISYTENDQATGAAANTATTTYDPNTGRISTAQDAHSTLSYSYNGGNDYRDLPTSMRVQVAGSTPYDGTYTINYDSNGAPASQLDPNGITTTLTRDENNQLTGLVALKGNAPWLSDTAIPNIYGEWLKEGNDAGTHHYSYDNLGRLTAGDNTPTGGACASRSYTFDKDSNRLTTTAYGAATDGSSCQTSSGGVSTSHSYDIADRITDSGVSYDTFGRITTLPAADTSNASTMTSAYYANDLVRSQTQASTTECWTLDPNQRLREATTYSATSCGGTVTADKTSHYDDASSDSPDWIAENSAQTTWTANVQDLMGGLGLTIDQAGTPTYDYSNLHGDTLATAAAGAASPTVSSDYDEFGNPTDHQVRRYGWLGEKQRSGDDLGGNLLMGVRVYDPLLGRFLSTDPEPGGSANAYDYCGQDPVNNTDLDGRNYASTGDDGDAATPAQAAWQANFLKHQHHNHKKKHKHHWWQKAKHWVSHHKLDIALTAAMFIPGVGEAAMAEEAELIASREIAEEAATVGERCVNSFTANTPVLMADGSQKPISAVDVGDFVLATDAYTGETSREPVVALIRHAGPHQMVRIKLSDGAELLATGGHLIWTSGAGFVAAERLRAGAVLSTPTGNVQVRSVIPYEDNLEAYNLEVRNIHTYYAGLEPVLVHNSCGLNLGHILRIGKGRISMGPARNHWNRMSPLGKRIGRFHVHVERRYGGLDDWITGKNWTWWQK